ncbi:hypothetical protein LOR37_15615 [Clostridium estertheticum]|nr:lipopolysaccharide kinase InaA family protein [Clostridium estertheticum]WBL46097.1 hypothetical protein LOR37_15615 [Clostridium estertheticum]
MSVMEYVKGCTLNDWLNSSKSNNRDLRNRIAKEILQTIKKCHDLKIYHGDLHSKNIIIS